VKDLFAVAGAPMSAGSRVLDGHVPDHDAWVVRRLRDRGAVLVGTTALDEFAFGTLGPGMANPADPGRVVGGSSGGSGLAVAAHLCFAALGTDTGGSVRIPARCCGVVGLKPSRGRLPTAGAVPLAWSLDHVGPLARTVRDVAHVLVELADLPAPAKVRTDLHGVTLGVPTEHYLRIVHEDVRAAFSHARAVLEELGATLVEVNLPDSDLALNLQYMTVLPEAASYHGARHGDRSGAYGDGVREAIEWGGRVLASEYLDAQRVRTTFAAALDHLFTSVAGVALPTMPVSTPVTGQEEVVLGDQRREDVVSGMLRYTALFNHTGHPAVSLPYRTHDGGLHGLQLAGAFGGEARLLEIAAAVESRLP
jgi:aspartyl-tRNA(Asn)/glutamyl-tRNA(Gln) amidotransferase subunit A